MKEGRSEGGKEGRREGGSQEQKGTEGEDEARNGWEQATLANEALQACQLPSSVASSRAIFFLDFCGLCLGIRVASEHSRALCESRWTSSFMREKHGKTGKEQGRTAGGRGWKRMKEDGKGWKRMEEDGSGGRRRGGRKQRKRKEKEEPGFERKKKEEKGR